MAIPNVAGRSGQRTLLLGNEAIARGFIEGGIQVASSYPGTPASEILFTLLSVAEKYGIYAEWSTNEKVAAEVAISAAMSGLRSVVSMKGVGVNVASEPFQAFTYMGTVGGIVLVSADDVGMHSSHTEQDNRLFAREAYLPIFEPPGPKGAHEMAKAALECSEKWGQPVLFRSTTRIGHSSADITLGPVTKTKRKGQFQRIPERWVNLPANARRMRLELIERMEKIKKEVEKLPFNKIISKGDGEFGVISCGVTHNVVREAFKALGLGKKVGLIRIGTPYPLPRKKIKRFLSANEKVIVVEEVEAFVETCLRSIAHELSLDTEIHGKDILPKAGEMGPREVAVGLSKFLGRKTPSYFGKANRIWKEAQALIPPRPPVLCPGCGHRTAFFAINVVEKNLKLKKKGGIVKPSDIGCYTLGYQSPLNAVDTNFCMGSSIGISTGLSKVIDNRIVCTIGDSTFFHSGIPPLLNAVYNKADINVLVLDNATTAMTGFQTHPGVGMTAMGEDTRKILIEDVAKACGVDTVAVVDALDLDALVKALEKAVKTKGVSVVVARHPCILLDVRKKRKKGKKIAKYQIDQDICTQCQLCMNLFGCPAFRMEEDVIEIDPALCNGCGVCANEMVCPQLAIKEVDWDEC
ncbi:MAG: indolepyruvate ferredoxin oxidoreductase subunit alpha [Methanomassiliicoccales archaeon]|nr:MAG: indolepyruvate ferredoxin oxidoreductase subunit alpha [Methanomassiliicoccales archaeon]